MNLRECILKSFEEILEQMVFLYFEETDENEIVPGNLSYITEISFNGAVSEILRLGFSRESGDEIARNLLGIRPDDLLWEGVAEDAICEFTNIVMGRTMALLNPGQDFDLGIPKLSETFAHTPPHGEILQLTGMLDEQPCLIELEYQKAETSPPHRPGRWQ